MIKISRPYQNARDMEADAAQMLKPGTLERIAQGLGELWRKAPAGIAEAVGKGATAGVKAVDRTVDTFLHDKRMHEGLKQAALFGLAGASLPAGIVGAYFAPALIPLGGQAIRAAGTTLLGNPQLINEAGDFVQGVLDQGPPPASKGGYLGGIASKIYDKVKK